MGNFTFFQMFENPRRGRQARYFTTNVPKILDVKSSFEQIFSENCRWVPLFEMQFHLIRHFQISQNAPYLSPHIFHNLCFSFLLGITAVPREIENNPYAKFWVANKVHYGKSGSGVQQFYSLYLYLKRSSRRHHQKEENLAHFPLVIRRLNTFPRKGGSSLNFR